MSLVERLRLPWWLWCFAAFALINALWHPPLPLHSTRTLGVAYEMWAQQSFIVPLMNGESYSHKPPLLYWLFHLGWAVGGVNDLWPRLVMIGIAVALLMLGQTLARRLYPESPRVAALFPWVLGASQFFFLYSGQLLFDGLMAVFVTLGALALLPHGARRLPSIPLLALAVAGGLLSKGPVWFVHAAGLLLFAWWWSAEARAQWLAFHARMLLGILAGIALAALWAVPALRSGGEDYAHAILWGQHAGRVVEAFDHARPPWWYFYGLLLLLAPWLYWRPAWRALPRLSHGLGTSEKMLLAWSLSAFVAFSIISGKQVYYLISWLVPSVLLLTAMLLRGDRDAAQGATTGRPWLLLLGMAGVGLLVLGLSFVAPERIAHGRFPDLAKLSPVWGLAIVLLALSLWPRLDDLGDQIRRLALVSMAWLTLLHGAFTQAAFANFDLRAASAEIARLQAAGLLVAAEAPYEVPFQFYGRLQQPLLVVPRAELRSFARLSPEVRIVVVRDELPVDGRPQPEYSQRFRSDWLQIWRGADFVAAEWE